jgi:hypothetical protein
MVITICKVALAKLAKEAQSAISKSFIFFCSDCSVDGTIFTTVRTTATF